MKAREQTLELAAPVWGQLLRASPPPSVIQAENTPAEHTTRWRSRNGACPVGDSPAETTKPNLLFRFRWRFGLLRLLEIVCPRRHHTNHSRIGDRLPEMLGPMPDDKDQHAALRILSAKPVKAFFQVGIGHGRNRFAGMGVGIFQSGNDFRLVGS